MGNLNENVSYARLWYMDITNKYGKRNRENLFKYILILCNALYFVLLTISISVASLSYNYSIVTNVVSDLGGTHATAMPFIFDIACVIGGLIMIPLYYMISEWLSKWDDRISKAVFKSGIIGTIGFIGIGVFSMDRGGPYQILHSITAALAFAGYMLSAFFLGIYLIKQNKSKMKYFGYFGIFFPFIMVILWGISLISLFEWLSFISIQGFTFSFNLRVLIG
jgi:hypothetical protein